MNRLSRILIELALEEDLRETGDLTSCYFVDRDHQSVARIVSREPAVISGHEVGQSVCASLSPDLVYKATCRDGARIEKGGVVAEISGPTHLILTAERTVLNFMQRLSGVATVAAQYREMISHTEAVLLDTRKTTPGMREMEKAAVAHGGGANHRIGLYDAVMVKDNHLAANASPVDLGETIRTIKEQSPRLKIEVEADNLEQVRVFLTLPGIDVILLDNMTNEQLEEAVRMRDRSQDPGSKMKLEASGGVSLSTISGIAETGVDFISVGALTHSVRSIDLGLDLVAG